MEKNLNPSRRGAASISSSTARSTVDRKTIERNRRNHMKSLFSQLNSIVPSSSREVASVSVSLPDQLDEAAKYIKKLQVKLEKMKEKKQMLSTTQQLNSALPPPAAVVGPKVSVHKTGLTLEVNLITSAAAVASCGYDQFQQVVRLLQEEGAEVVNANFSVVGNTVFHSFHSMLAQDMPLHSSHESIQSKISEILASYTNY